MRWLSFGLRGPRAGHRGYLEVYGGGRRSRIAKPGTKGREDAERLFVALLQPARRPCVDTSAWAHARR